jgi:peptidoglycan/xylan/chitin deacetylase (PgdA/CDA1 family)
MLLTNSYPGVQKRLLRNLPGLLCGMLVAFALPLAAENHPEPYFLRCIQSMLLATPSANDTVVPIRRSKQTRTVAKPAEETSGGKESSKGETPPPAIAKPETPENDMKPEDRIEVILTFDDGPHVQPLNRGKNHTEQVVRGLKNNILQEEIKAVFFVQTHAPGRGGTPTGMNVISVLAKEGHVVGIHTGSRVDHASHRQRVTARPYDADGNRVIDAADGLNGLESDLIRAKAKIHGLTGSVPLYVRPTYGERNSRVTDTYERQGLQMILWDIDSGDNLGSSSVDIVNQNIDEGMRRCVAAGKGQVVVLFHDINSRTTDNLEEYLGNICISAKRLGKTVVFPTSAARIIEILNAKRY